MRAAKSTGVPQRATAPRERVCIDLRGLGPRIQARAASRQMTTAALVRRAVVTLLDEESPATDDTGPPDRADGEPVLKVTLRLSVSHAVILASRARVADVSQGRYVAGLIDGMPPQPRSVDHARAVAALMASTDRLAVLSADLNAFMRLLGRVPRSELEPLCASLQSLGADVRKHLAAAAALVASLRGVRGQP